MAKKDKDPAEIALAALVSAMNVSNEFSNPSTEIARVDAAEIILKLATPGEKEAAVAALDFLVRAVENKIASLNAQLRARAAGIILRYKREIL